VGEEVGLKQFVKPTAQSKQEIIRQADKIFG